MEIILFVVVSLFLSPVQTEDGVEGGQVTINCSHRFAGSNPKYFCREPCAATDVLVRTDGPQTEAKNGRFSLYDRGDGSFAVTLSGLKRSDAGTYWCGVDRPFRDTYLQVHLTVQAGEAAHRGPEKEKGVTTEDSGGTGELVYVGAGLGVAMLLLLAVLLLLLVHQRNTARTGKNRNNASFHAAPANRHQDTGRDITSVTTSITTATKQPATGASGDDITNIYSNVGPCRETGGVNYTTVFFNRETAQPIAGSVAQPHQPIRETGVQAVTDSVSYSTVDVAKDSNVTTTYSTVKSTQ